MRILNRDAKIKTLERLRDDFTGLSPSCIREKFLDVGLFMSYVLSLLKDLTEYKEVNDN